MNRIVSKNIVRTLVACCFFLVLMQCKDAQADKVIQRGLLADSAMVVSARKEASEIGVSILRKGGNAFDAMIATDLALTVSYPIAGNIGGGGFMVYRTRDGKSGSIDYREKAPLGASRDMYLDNTGSLIDGKSTLGAMAVGIPGTIAGLFEIHEKHCSLPFAELINPAIELARNGVVVTESQARNLNNHREAFKKANATTIALDREWRKGDTLRNAKLALTFERIRDLGRNEFYQGATASMIVDHLQKLGGIIDMEDLARYKAKWRDPIKFEYKSYQVISMAPPSSGGICLNQLMKSIEPFDIGQYEHNSEKYIQLITEAERRVYADRAFFLGDPDFVHIQTDTLGSEAYNKKRMADFSWENATSSAEVSHGNIEVIESEQTTHYSIVDRFGNAVAVTTTLNAAYGSKVFVEEAGFFLNNEMDDFSAKIGSPNIYGLIGAEANAIEPEKRMLSSMTPTIVEKDGKLKLVVGSPGGSTIITSVFQNILNIIEYDMGMQESVEASRFHHQWLPDKIRFEKTFDTIDFGDLRNKGYRLEKKPSTLIGRVDAILILEDGTLEGGADPRGDDTATGY